jgi:hypothetical protein
MADPFGIIGVIGFVSQIIQIGAQFGLDWKDAPADAKSFIGELQALKTVLSETNSNVAVNEDFANAFHGQHSLMLSQLGPAAPLTDTKLMLQVCQTELATLLGDLRKRLTGGRLGWERVKGAFLARKTREAVENLHRQCQTLNGLMAVDALSLTVNIHKQVKDAREEQKGWHKANIKAQEAVKEHVDRLRSHQDAQEADNYRNVVLNWLTPMEYSTQQKDFIYRRQEGTGQWLLDSSEFKAWVKTQNQTLFCPGIPGAGKTILTSIVVEHLHSLLQKSDGTAIAYLYCNFNQQDEQKAEDILAALLKQLARDWPSLPASVQALHDSHKDMRTRPSFDELSKTLQSVTALYSKVFIIIDALDECQASGGCRSKILSDIFRLQEKYKVNFFVTSRFIPDIMDKFSQSIHLEIRASKEDIERYLEGHIGQLSAADEWSGQLQDEIKSGISDAVDGMYVTKLYPGDI